MVLGVLAPVGPAGASAPPARAAAPRQACSENPFTKGFGAYVAQRWPRNRISAAVYDDATGCEYTYRPDHRLTTASVIKIEIMAAVLLRAQRAGRGLTQWEQDRIWPMITESANTPASELWNSLGGVPAMAAFERELGLTETVAAGPTWGLTTTSASDRNRVLRQVLLGEYGPLDATSRAIARSYMLEGGALPTVGCHRRGADGLVGAAEERLLRLPLLQLADQHLGRRRAARRHQLRARRSCRTGGRRTRPASRRSSS